jgi:hypothetical protein
LHRKYIYTKKILRGRGKHLSDKKNSHVGRNFGAHLGSSAWDLSSFVSCLQVMQLWTTSVCKALITKRRHSNTIISSILMRKYIDTRRVHSKVVFHNSLLFLFIVVPCKHSKLKKKSDAEQENNSGNTEFLLAHF